MLDALIRVADRLIDLQKYRNERRAKIFDALIDPLMRDLTTVHGDYIRILDDLRRKLASVGKRSAAAEVRAATEYLLAARLEEEPLRRRIEAVAFATQSGKAGGDATSRFAAAVLDYMQSRPGAAASLGTLLLMQLKHGGDNLAVAKRITESVLPEYNRLIRERWTAVADAYAAAKMDAVTR